MDLLWNGLTLVGGLCLFLFGMNLLGQGLEARAGGGLQKMLGKLTSGKLRGLLLGMGITVAIQSSSAVTVMLIGFVNSGIMTLRQAIGVIMGANIGTTLTSWILGLTGIESDNLFLRLLKPSSFTPILALIGIWFYLFSKNEKRKATGTVLLGFTVLMFGMETMSGAVEPLAALPRFREILLLFTNPLFGVLAGALLTALIQSSSASIGILQALSATGQMTVGAAVPIIMGQNIGTCVTTLLSSVGASRNAKRTAVVHLYFNLLGTLVLLVGFYFAHWLLRFSFFDDAVTPFSIAAIHTAFNLVSTALLFPFTGWLEKLAVRTVPDRNGSDPAAEDTAMLDPRFLKTPALAVGRSRDAAILMSDLAVSNVRAACALLADYSDEGRKAVEETENRVDRLEDGIGNYLISLGGQNMNADDSTETTGLLRVIGDAERLSDHAVNLAESAEEINEKKIRFPEPVTEDLNTLIRAVEEVMQLTLRAFRDRDRTVAAQVEPLEQVIDGLQNEIRVKQAERLRQGICSMDEGFVISDILTDLERVSDHCSNVAGYVIEASEHQIGVHAYLRAVRSGGNEEYGNWYRYYRERYALPEKL